MRVNAANDIEATARAIGDARVQFRVGVHRFTATPDEAIEFARQLVDAAEACTVLPGAGKNHHAGGGGNVGGVDAP